MLAFAFLCSRLGSSDISASTAVLKLETCSSSLPVSKPTDVLSQPPQHLETRGPVEACAPGRGTLSCATSALLSLLSLILLSGGELSNFVLLSSQTRCSFFIAITLYYSLTVLKLIDILTYTCVYFK